MSATVAAIIPNWNGLRFLKPLWQDLVSQSLPFDQIIVVDNGSTDGSPEFAESEGARVVRLGTNRGFAAAVNAGAAAAGGDAHLAILNNDIRLNRDRLQRMVEGIGPLTHACGKVLSAAEPTRIDATWDAVCRGGTAVRCGSGRPDGPEWSEPREITFSPFTAVLVRRDHFIELGGLDEAFESYLEDVDFGLRCGSKGYKGRYLPEAQCFHVGSATLGKWNVRTVRQIARNQVLLVARHYRSDLIREFGWQIAVSHLLWGLVALRHGSGGAWLAGKWDGLRSFRRWHREGSDSVRALLSSSEREIQRTQERTGYDLYWRLYFALT